MSESVVRFTFNNIDYSPTGKDQRRKSDVAIYGAPFDLTSDRGTGQREAPSAIRSAVFYKDTARSPIYGLDPFELLTIVDAGDVDYGVGDTAGGTKAIRDKARLLYSNSRHIIGLGGDQSMTAMAAAAVAEKEGPLTIFHFDAHSDYWKPDAGMELDSGTWVRWALDNGVANRVVQFGVRSIGVTHAEQVWASKNDVTTYWSTTGSMMQRLSEELADTSDAIYLSVDLGALDPAFAPGVAGQEPGGLTSRELLGMVYGVASSRKMVAGDVTELVPALDTNGMTAKVAHRCVMQMLYGLASVK